MSIFNFGRNKEQLSHAETPEQEPENEKREKLKKAGFRANTYFLFFLILTGVSSELNKSLFNFNKEKSKLKGKETEKVDKETIKKLIPEEPDKRIKGMFEFSLSGAEDEIKEKMKNIDAEFSLLFIKEVVAIARDYVEKYGDINMGFETLFFVEIYKKVKEKYPDDFKKEGELLTEVAKKLLEQKKYIKDIEKTLFVLVHAPDDKNK